MRVGNCPENSFSRLTSLKPFGMVKVLQTTRRIGDSFTILTSIIAFVILTLQSSLAITQNASLLRTNFILTPTSFNM